MSKKRFLAMLMAGAMALTMTACGSKPADEGGPADGGDDASAGGAHKIALIAQHQTNAFQIAIAEAAEAKAKEMITKKDKQRQSYYNYYSSKKWGRADSYDLCINSSILGIEGTVKLIIQYVEDFEKKNNADILEK